MARAIIASMRISSRALSIRQSARRATAPGKSARAVAYPSVRQVAKSGTRGVQARWNVPVGSITHALPGLIRSGRAMTLARQANELSVSVEAEFPRHEFLLPQRLCRQNVIVGGDHRYRLQDR